MEDYRLLTETLSCLYKKEQDQYTMDPVSPSLLAFYGKTAKQVNSLFSSVQCKTFPNS